MAIYGGCAARERGGETMYYEGNMQIAKKYKSKDTFQSMEQNSELTTK